jgi:hypothetical protein
MERPDQTAPHPDPHHPYRAYDCLGGRSSGFPQAKKRHFKAKYKTQLNMADQECAILNKKRNARPASGLFATRPKYKPQAEIDPPRYAVVR